MRITEFSLRKPILVVVAVILIIMLGIMGYSNIGSDFFPAVNIPIINISSTYPGASAEDIEREIIKPIEDAVSGISGLDKLNSMATEGIAKVTLSFKLSADSDEALFDVQKALEKNSDKIPKEATKPSIEKFDQNAGPILILTISGNKSFEELNSEAETIKKQLQGVKGIGSINIFGGSKKELQINVDKTKLDFYNIGITQIVNQIKQNNIDFPGGVLYQKNQDRVINFKGEFKNINQVTDLSIPLNKGSVRLGDLAKVTLDYPKVSEMARVNGTPAIGLIIHKESDANIVKTGKRDRKSVV
jgi:HAE1 family hydrophobic/amphiphilic exporter-1